MSDVKATCPTPVGSYIHHHTGEHKPIPCNRWSCPYCGPIKKWRVAQRVNKGFHPEILAGQRIRALTLTQKLGTNQYIMDCWTRFRALLAKRNYHLMFFWSKEFTINGERHLHVLINAYIPQPVLQHCWTIATHGESYIVWITGKEFPDMPDGDIFNPAGYATKYLTKAYGQDYRFEKGERRYGFSRSPLFRYNPVKIFCSLSVAEFWDYIVGVTPWTKAVLLTDFGRHPLKYIGEWKMDEIKTYTGPCVQIP